MGKKKKIDKSKEKTVKSVNNGIRSSVRKLNPILRSIVGKKVDVAIRDLQFSEKRITRDVRKTISSAVANAENNFQYDIDKLIVKEAYCGKKIIMSKKKKIENNKDKVVRSVNNNIRSSVRKLNPILRGIVGKKVDIAIRDLQFSEKRITKDIRKTISSAVANAENNFQYDIDNLIVKEAYCGKKITMKRFRPRAKGRAASILKPYSSVTIILSEAKKMESHGTKS